MATDSSPDFYSRLNVSRDAKQEVLRKSYRRLARKYHPDVNPGDSVAEKRFKEIREAYDVLSDAKKRKFYDKWGFYSDQAYAQGSRAGPERTAPGGINFDGFDFPGYSGQTGGSGGFETIFDSLLGRRRSWAGQEKRTGEDLEYSMEIGFGEAIKGTSARLNITRLAKCRPCGGSGTTRGASAQVCPTCNGTGQGHQQSQNMRFSIPCPTCRGQGATLSPCSNCRGEGRTSKNSLIDVRIPAGTQENGRLRLQGKGNDGLKGGPPGDLYITAVVGKHPFFERKGYDIHTKVPITPAEAILGAKIEVPTIDGTALLKIPPATNSGKVFRVRERGIKHPNSAKRGHQFVCISIVVPEIPEESTKKLMQRYKELNPENPRENLLEEF